MIEFIGSLWNNYILPNWKIIMIIIQLLIDFYFAAFLWRSSRRDGVGHESFIGLYITILALIVFAVIVIGYLKVNYDSYKISAMNTLTDPVSITIANMQATTLAISTLVVTMASIIIAILTLFRERKTELNNKEIEKSLSQLAKADAELQALSSIISIQFIDERQRECYHDAIQHYLMEIESSKDDYLCNRFRVTRLSVMNGMAQIQKNPADQLEIYQNIVNTAEEVISNRSATLLDKRFSFLEILHALYQIIKLKIDKSPKSANTDIDKAIKYLRKVSSFDDSYGHIANTKGLIHLWSGIAKIRMGEEEEAPQCHKDAIGFFEKAIKSFNEALTINPNRTEFLNHKSVALQQLYDISPNKELNIKLKETLNLICERDPQYGKGQLNLASYEIRELRKKLCLQPLSEYPDYSEEIEPKYDFCELYQYALGAKEKLIKAKQLCPTMINCYYKMGELLTLIIVMKKQNNINAVKEIEEAEQAFDRAEQMNADHLSYLYCKYAFLMLEENKREDAEKIKRKIEEQKSQINNTSV